jgi:hypothetical protein
VEQVLNLRDNRIGEHGSAAMMEAFRNDSDVHTIDLANNQIGRHGVILVHPVFLRALVWAEIEL